MVRPPCGTGWRHVRPLIPGSAFEQAPGLLLVGSAPLLGEERAPRDKQVSSGPRVDGRAVKARAFGARADGGALVRCHADALVVTAGGHEADRSGQVAEVEDASASARVAARHAADAVGGVGRKAGQVRAAFDARRAFGARRAGYAARERTARGGSTSIGNRPAGALAGNRLVAVDAVGIALARRAPRHERQKEANDSHS